MIWLHRYAKLVTLFTVLLIAAGGMVTSTSAGLSVPDWPNTYGWFMFSFPYSKWVGGIFYEHSHRLIASTVGLLTIGLAVWTSLAEPRRWVRRLAWLALGTVVFQGVLGGLTVLFFLPASISIGHAGLAQIFFCLALSITVFTSSAWACARNPVDDAALRRLTVLTTIAVYVQILLGATMRHTDAGLAIPDFPLAFGHLVPPFWSAKIAIHFAHRVGALAVTLLILATAVRVWRRHGERRALAGNATWLVFFLATQVTLGAFVVLTGKQPIVNTAHVVNGALVLGTALVLTLRSFRVRFERTVAVEAPARVLPDAPARAEWGGVPATQARAEWSGRRGPAERSELGGGGVPATQAKSVRS